MAARLRIEFRKRFGRREPRLFRAPGRVNLIGEHTDYTDGFVMPLAIDLHAWVATAPRDDRSIRVHSLNVGETAEIDLAECSRICRGIGALIFWAWRRRWRMRPVRARSGPTGGRKRADGCGAFVLCVGGSGDGLCDVVDSGLRCRRRNSRNLPGARKMSTRARWWHHGSDDGGMRARKLRAAAGLPHARVTNCCRFSGDAQFVVCNSMVKHDHAANEYNQRRADCETAARLLGVKLPGVRTLRDVASRSLSGLRR